MKRNRYCNHYVEGFWKYCPICGEKVDTNQISKGTTSRIRNVKPAYSTAKLAKDEYNFRLFSVYTLEQDVARCNKRIKKANAQIENLRKEMKFRRDVFKGAYGIDLETLTVKDLNKLKEN